MNFSQAKTLSLLDYLSSLGFKPINIKGNNAWFLSPFHEEKRPSFKIDLAKNVWYDFSIGKGGGISDFVQIKYKTNNPTEILSIIRKTIPPTDDNNFSFHQQEIKKATVNFSVRSLQSPNLISYLVNIRGISSDVACNECCELHWNENDRDFYAIAFKNEAEGYEVRSAYNNYKRCFGRKSITHIKQAVNKSICCVFEGFIDYMTYISYLECKSHSDGKALDYDYLILNSVALVNMAIDFLKNYSIVYTFLDNDSAGVNATEELKTKLINCISISEKFAPHKDFNEWHISNQNSLKKTTKEKTLRRIK